MRVMFRTTQNRNSMSREVSCLLEKYPNDLKLKEVEEKVNRSYKHLLTITNEKISNSHNFYEAELNKISDCLSKGGKNILKITLTLMRL